MSGKCGSTKECSSKFEQTVFSSKVRLYGMCTFLGKLLKSAKNIMLSNLKFNVKLLLVGL